MKTVKFRGNTFWKRRTAILLPAVLFALAAVLSGTLAAFAETGAESGGEGVAEFGSTASIAVYDPSYTERRHYSYWVIDRVRTAAQSVNSYLVTVDDSAGRPVTEADVMSLAVKVSRHYDVGEHRLYFYPAGTPSTARTEAYALVEITRGGAPRLVAFRGFPGGAGGAQRSQAAAQPQEPPPQSTAPSQSQEPSSQSTAQPPQVPDADGPEGETDSPPPVQYSIPQTQTPQASAPAASLPATGRSA